MSEDQPDCCDFCLNLTSLCSRAASIRSSASAASVPHRLLSEITPQPVPEPAPPPERPSKEALLASIPSPKTLVAHLDQYVIGQDIAKRRLALGVSNHFKRLVDTWDCGAPDPIIADPDLHNVRIEKSNILLIGPSGSGKTHLVKSLASFAVQRVGISVYTRDDWLDSDNLLCIVKYLGGAGVWCLFPYEKEMVMAVVARIIGYSLLTAGLGAVLGFALFWQLPDHDRNGLSFVLACLGTIVGAVAGAAGEIVTAQRRLTKPEPLKRMSKTYEAWD